MIDLEQLDGNTRERLLQLAEEMGQGGVDKDDPSRSVMAMLGDRWSPLILLVLETGAWRHADLRRVTSELASEPQISQRILTMKLRALERDGFVSRHATQEVPPKVTYSLTELGVQLVGQLRAMQGWLNKHRPAIIQARLSADSAEEG